jgi:hypothetical protein
MAITIKKNGYGQVEPNHLSAQRTGQIYAQLPAEASIKVLENGQFAKYDYASGNVNFSAEGQEFMLVLNEVKLYDERDTYKDFAMLKENYVNGEMVPRLFKTNVGDIFTTNCFKSEVSLSVGDKLTPGTDGYLAAGEGEMVWVVVKEYTMPDGQPAVKIQRVK